MRIFLVLGLLGACTAVAGMIGTATAHASTDCAVPAASIGEDHPQQGELMVNAQTECSAARFAISNGRLTRSGNLVARGWTCRVTHRYHSGGVTLGAKIKCRKGIEGFSFAWAT